MRNVAARNVSVSREESDRLEEEAERLERELQRIRELRTGAAAVPAAGSEVRAADPSAAAVPRWRSAAETADIDDIDEEDPEEDALAARLLNVVLEAERPPAARRASSERPPVRKAGEFGNIEAFLSELGLPRRYAAVFAERGLDSAEAVAALSPNQLRALGVEHRHAMRLRMGIAELRAFGTPSVPPKAPAAPRPVPPASRDRPPRRPLAAEPSGAAGPASNAPRRPPAVEAVGRPPVVGRSERSAGRVARARSVDCAPQGAGDLRPGRLPACAAGRQGRIW